MNAAELQKQIHLSPRAIIITGSLVERFKESQTGRISGLTPHHAIKGIPTVPFTHDEPVLTYMDGACIECDIREPAPCASAALAYGNVLNLVHLIFGNKSIAPTNNELMCLREAGEILRANVGRPVHLAALPILVAGQYGVAQGRLYVLGLFDSEGQALFINPAAREKLLTAEFPAHQQVRTLAQHVPALAAAPAKATSALPEWYQTTADTVAVFIKQKGAKLHQAVLETRASTVAKAKKISMKAALAEVTSEYDNCQKAAAAAQPSQAVSVPVTPASPAKRSLLRSSV